VITTHARREEVAHGDELQGGTQAIAVYGRDEGKGTGPASSIVVTIWSRVPPGRARVGFVGAGRMGRPEGGPHGRRVLLGAANNFCLRRVLASIGDGQRI
jgi:hypothetical protein